MGKSSPKIKVPVYKMSLVLGICHGIVDRVLSIKIKEKLAWSSFCKTEARWLIDKPGLFGGLKKEGGVQGFAYFQPGNSTQKIHADLALKMGGTPDTLPGFRDIATLGFTEATGQSGGKSNPGFDGPGFYWSANQPFVPGFWAEVERIGKPSVMVGYSWILRSTAAPTIEWTLTQGATFATRDVDDDNVAIDFARRRLYITDFAPDNNNHGIQVWDLDTLGYVTTYLYPQFEGPPRIYGFDPQTGYLIGLWWGFSNQVENWVIDPADGSVVSYHFPRDNDSPTDPSTLVTPHPFQVVRDTNTGAAALISRPFDETIYRLHTFPAMEWITDVVGPDLTGNTWHSVGMCPGADGEAWGGWITDGQFDLVRLTPGGGSVFTTLFPGDIDPTATSFLAITKDPQPYYDPSDNTVIWPIYLNTGDYYTKWSPVYGVIWTTKLLDGTEPLSGGIPSIGYNITSGNTLVLPTFDTGPNKLVHVIDLNSGLVTTTDLGVVADFFGFWWNEAEGCAYDWAFIGGGEPETQQALRRWCTCDESVRDMNPAHIIAECLTNPIWGLGHADTALDAGSFHAAALTLFNEGFGLSMMWTQSDTIENFVQEVLDHIEAALFIDPATGLFRLKLIRADYDEATLPVMDPTNSTIRKMSRRSLTEVINEIVVTWTNPANEEEETITIQDLGAIVAAGTVNSDSRNYYGVHKRDLATKLAARDIRSSAAPLASIEADANRQFWNLVVGDVVKVVYPEYDVETDDPLVMRVMEVDYGKPGASTIKVKMTEDVFSLTPQAFEIAPGTELVSQQDDPTPADDTRVLTLPFFFAFNLIDPQIASTTEYPDVFMGVLAAESDTDATSFELHGEEVDPAGNATLEPLGERGMVAQGTLQNSFAWEADSTVSDWGALSNGTGPSVGGFALIGGDAETEATMELILLTGVTNGIWSVKRGVLDTVPRAWPAGTKIWFLSTSESIEDETIRAAGALLDYKVQPQASGGQLPLSEAPLIQYTATERPHLPSRPANVAIDGKKFQDVYFTTKPATVPLTWADRNRETENAQVLGWTDAGVAPEVGQTVEVDAWGRCPRRLLDSRLRGLGRRWRRRRELAQDRRRPCLPAGRQVSHDRPAAERRHTRGHLHRCCRGCHQPQQDRRLGRSCGLGGVGLLPAFRGVAGLREGRRRRAEARRVRRGCVGRRSRVEFLGRQGDSEFGHDDHVKHEHRDQLERRGIRYRRLP